MGANFAIIRWSVQQQNRPDSPVWVKNEKEGRRTFECSTSEDTMVRNSNLLPQSKGVLLALGLGASALSPFGSNSADALTIPPTQLSPFIELGNTKGTVYLYNPGLVYNNPTISRGYAGESVESNGHNQTMTATAKVASSSGDNAQIGARSQVNLVYYFALFGPGVAGGIPVDVSGRVSVSSAISGLPYTAFAFAESSITVAGTAAQAAVDISGALSHLSQSRTATLNDTVYLDPGVVYDVQLNVDAEARAEEGSQCGSHGLNCHPVESAANVIASLDPYFMIDKSVANPSDYSFVFSDGIGNVSTVPLPATAPMFGAALLALGTIGYGLKIKKLATAA